MKRTRASSSRVIKPPGRYSDFVPNPSSSSEDTEAFSIQGVKKPSENQCMERVRKQMSQEIERSSGQKNASGPMWGTGDNGTDSNQQKEVIYIILDKL